MITNVDSIIIQGHNSSRKNISITYNNPGFHWILGMQKTLICPCRRDSISTIVCVWVWMNASSLESQRAMDLLNTIGVTNTQYVETFTFKQCTICKCILFIYLLPTSSKWLFFIFNIYLEVTNFPFNWFIFFRSYCRDATSKQEITITRSLWTHLLWEI